MSDSLVQIQLDCYNKQDLEGFLEVYAPDVEIYTHPNTLNYTGREEMRMRYSKLFKDFPDNHAELVSRMVLNNHVIDHERITGRGPEPSEAIAIYEVNEQYITKVWFMR